jgi:NADPH:quinone reductase-like Zn-dependent oxidoreductase
MGSVLRTHNAGRGADVIFNTAGGPIFGIALDLLAHRGRQVEITAPTERRVTFDLVNFYHNESQLFGVDTLKGDLTASGRILEELRRASIPASIRRRLSQRLCLSLTPSRPMNWSRRASADGWF